MGVWSAPKAFGVHRNAYNIDGHQNNHSLFVASCTFVRRPDYTCRRGIVRQKDQKDFCADTNAESVPETSKGFNEESDPDSVARDFAQTQKSFTESLANADAQEQIKAQKNNSDANPRARRKSVSDSCANAC